MNKIQIINDLIPGALLSFKEYNILPSLTIAQAILETGWLDHVKGNNIFGIKWTTGCGYEVQEFSTFEFINGLNTHMIWERIKKIFKIKMDDREIPYQTGRPDKMILFKCKKCGYEEEVPEFVAFECYTPDELGYRQQNAEIIL